MSSKLKMSMVLDRINSLPEVNVCLLESSEKDKILQLLLYGESSTRSFSDMYSLSMEQLTEFLQDVKDYLHVPVAGSDSLNLLGNALKSTTTSKTSGYMNDLF